MQIKDYLELGLGAVEAEDGENCLIFSEKILDLEPKSPEGWFIRAVGTNLTSVLGNPKVKEILYAINNALKFSTSDHIEFRVTVVSNLISVIDNMISFTIQEYQNSRGFSIEASVNKDLFKSIHSTYVVHTWEMREGLTADMLALDDSFPERAKNLLHKAYDVIKFMNIAEPSKSTMLSAFSKGIEDYFESINSKQQVAGTVDKVFSPRDRNINWFWMIFWIVVFWPGAIVYYFISKEND
jgi:hypothetical protein